MIMESVAQWYASTRALGYIVTFGVLGMPLYLAVLSSLFEPPFKLRTTAMFLGTALAIVVGWILLFLVTDVVTGIFIA